MTASTKRLLLGAIAASLVAFNIVAYNQAWSMSHFTAEGERTGKAESLMGLAKLKVLFFGPNVVKPRNDKDPSHFHLRFSTVTFPGGQGEPLEAWSVRAPTASRNWVLLFHGYAASKSQLLEDAEAFVKLGWNALLVDFPGHGGSGGTRTTIGFHEGKDVLASLDYARRELGAEKSVLFGVSMGSAAILRALSREGAKADGIIIESPFDRFLGTVRNRFKVMNLPPTPAAETLVFWGSVQVGANLFNYNLSDEAKNVGSPALVLAGEADNRATLDDAKLVYANMIGPKELSVFSAGHQSFRDANPKQWSEAVRRFLKKLS